MTKKPTDRDASTQETETGYEIPIPTKNDVMADLEKIAPKNSRKGHSRKKR